MLFGGKWKGKNMDGREAKRECEKKCSCEGKRRQINGITTVRKKRNRENKNSMFWLSDIRPLI